MNGENKKPPYVLEALLKKRRWDLDAASVEIATARHAVELRAQEASRIGKSIEELEREIREVCADGERIEPARHEALSTYLEDRRQALIMQIAELKKAEEEYEQTRHRLFRIKQGVMVLEKHKEGKDREHAQQALRNEQHQADDLWLQRRQEE